MQPFSAYHALCLMQFDSPFIFAGDEPGLGDIAQALCIMAEGFDDHLKKTLRLCNSTPYSLRWSWRLWLMGKKKRQAVIDQINKHIEFYGKYPKLWSANGEKGSGVPWPFLVAGLIWRSYKCTEAEAWDMGLIRASCYRALVAEENGLDIVDEQGLEGVTIEWLNAPNKDDFKTVKEYIAWKEKS